MPPFLRTRDPRWHRKSPFLHTERRAKLHAAQIPMPVPEPELEPEPEPKPVPQKLQCSGSVHVDWRYFYQVICWTRARHHLLRGLVFQTRSVPRQESCGHSPIDRIATSGCSAPRTPSSVRRRDLALLKSVRYWIVRPIPPVSDEFLPCAGSGRHPCTPQHRSGGIQGLIWGPGQSLSSPPPQGHIRRGWDSRFVTP